MGGGGGGRGGMSEWGGLRRGRGRSGQTGHKATAALRAAAWAHGVPCSGTQQDEDAKGSEKYVLPVAVIAPKVHTRATLAIPMGCVCTTAEPSSLQLVDFNLLVKQVQCAEAHTVCCTPAYPAPSSLSCVAAVCDH